MTKRFLIILTVLFMGTLLRADNSLYENWPPEQEWSDLTNHLSNCYEAILTRCVVSGVSTNNFAPPSYIYPRNDYFRYTQKIEELCPQFICTTNFGADGTLDDYFATGGTNDTFPMWTTETLLDDIGCTNWADTPPLTLWLGTDHSIQTQVVAAINRLIWTKKYAAFQYTAPSGGYGYGFATNGNWSASKQEAEDDWELDGASYMFMGTTAFYADDRQQCHSDLFTTKCHFAAVLKTNYAHEVQFYLYAEEMLPSIGDANVFDDFGLGVRNNRYTYHDTVSSNWSLVAFSPDFGSLDMPSPWCENASSSVTDKTRGFDLEDCRAAVRWFLPELPDSIPIYENHEEYDTDRDDIIEIASHIDTFGLDSGSIVFGYESELPSVLLPIAVSPVWSGIPTIHAYISQGGSTNLPYQYLVPEMTDNDGCYQAYSLNTCVIECGFITNDTIQVKNAAVLRPRGNVVIFDFAWDDSSDEFFADGYPIGINSNRTYVLRDVTPEDHTDKEFDLYFESGIIHHFSGAITSISDEVGMQILVSANSIPGASISITNEATDAKYDVALTWTEGQLTEIAYGSKDDASTITVDVDYDTDEAYITGISKTGINDSDFSISGNTITYDWGTATRSESGNDVKITTALNAGGSLVEDYELNAARRITEYKITANGDSAATEYEYYDSVSGRYDNGTLKNAKLKKTTYPDNTTVEYVYDSDTGWLTEEKSPVGNGTDRYTDYAYSHAGDSTANETNLYERPRMVSQSYGATEISRTYYAYTGAEQTEIQECASAGAAWNAAANLITTNSYCTGDLTNGLLHKISTPLGNATFNYTVSGLTGDEFTSLGKLTTESIYSTGQSATNTVNAFGTLEKSITTDTDSGQNTSSEISTVDAFGRLTQTAYLDGTTKSYSSRTLHGPGTITGIDGSDTTYDYYNNGRIKEIDRGDTGILIEYQYDALGNLTATTATGDDGITLTSTASYDSQSRPIAITDPIGTTTYSYTDKSYGTETSITHADYSVLTRESYRNGSIKQITGSAAKAKRQYEYGIDGGQFFAKQIRPVGGATTEWTKNTFDALGNVVEVENSGSGGESTTLAFDDKGRLEGWEDEESIAHILTYTDRNRIQNSGLDFNADGSLAAASRDRYNTAAYSVSASGRKHSSYVYSTDNNSTSNLLSETQIALDGTQITTAYAGRTDTANRSGYTFGGTFSVTNNLSDGTKVSQQYQAWRLTETKRYESGSGTPWETETRTYDGLGALTEIDNSRTGKTTLEYDSARRLTDVTLPDPEKWPIKIRYHQGTDRIKFIRDTDGSFKRFDYHDNGLLKRRYDLGSYDTTYQYDDQGRRTKQTTDRDGTPVDTDWIYDSTSGLLTQKKIAGITAATYTYRDNAQPSTTTDADGITATRAYNTGGDLNGITYTGGTTAPVGITFNRRGQIEASGQSGITNTFAYTLDGQLATNTVNSTSGAVPNALLTYTYGATHSGLTHANYTVGGAMRSLAFGRNNRKLVSTITEGSLTAQYSYTADAPLATTLNITIGGTNILTRTTGWDTANNRITNITCSASGSNLAAFAYTWQTNADRIASITLADNSRWNYEYDTRGHLTKGERTLADGTPCAGQQYGAAFDSIGNTIKSGSTADGVAPENSFAANNLNVHVSRSWSNKVELLGRAATNVTVTVNNEPTTRSDEWFRAVITVDNTAAAVETNITITAVWFDSVASNDVIATATGTILVPKASESPAYNNSASITQASRYENTFDAFGRLTEIITTATTPQVREQYSYYADGRRATKTTATGTPGNWTTQTTHTFTYDNWNLIAETISPSTGNPSTNFYTWGLDLAGQRNGEIGQQAGGIGGLLAIRHIENGTTNTYLPIANHIGNITHLVDADTGEVAANYLYSPYGKLIGEWGEAKDICPFRFQSKYLDAQTGLYYFGYRYYDPETIKWLTRDPLEEKGGINLTAAFKCDPVNNYDALGLEPLKWEEIKSRYSGHENIEELNRLRETILQIPVNAPVPKGFEKLAKYRQAAINLHRFLDVEKRKGLTVEQDTVTIDPKWLNNSKAIQKGKKYNRKRFMGKVEKDESLGDKHIHEWAAAQLEIKGVGEVKVPATEWHRMTLPSWAWERHYFAAHNISTVAGEGEFVAKKTQDGKVAVTGRVNWRWYDTYNWDKEYHGMPLAIPRIKNGKIQVKQIHVSDRVWMKLQKAGLGKPYKMKSNLGSETISWTK